MSRAKMARLVREIDRLLQVADELSRSGEGEVESAGLREIQRRLQAIRNQVDSGLSVAVVRHSVNHVSAELLDCLARRKTTGNVHARRQIARIAG
jgi:hypothetical protein